MNLTEYEKPIPTHASKASVSNFAEHVAKEMSFANGGPIEAIVAELGGTVSYQNPMGESVQESIRVEADSTFVIFLPTLTSATRDRFTIAHELGHFFLHFPIVQQTYPGKGMRATRWVDENDKDLQRCEWEANWFAAGFVMPKEEFLKACEVHGVAKAAELFGVSLKAAEVRAKSLGFVS